MSGSLRSSIFSCLFSNTIVGIMLVVVVVMDPVSQGLPVHRQSRFSPYGCRCLLPAEYCPVGSVWLPVASPSSDSSYCLEQCMRSSYLSWLAESLTIRLINWIPYTDCIFLCKCVCIKKYTRSYVAFHMVLNIFKVYLKSCFKSSWFDNSSCLLAKSNHCSSISMVCVLNYRNVIKHCTTELWLKHPFTGNRKVTVHEKIKS